MNVIPTENQFVIITALASEICWWSDCLGQVCPVLEKYEPTQYIKIRVVRVEQGFEHEPYDVEGWIPERFVEYVD